jgi:hypothetical protein
MSVLKDGLKETKVIYELVPDQIKVLIANDLDVPVEKVSVHYVIQEVGGDPLDRYRGTDTVTKIMVTVK